MNASQRGFTLVETIVVVGIVAVLLAAGGVWMLGAHPGALAQALDDYDSALSSARALAATGGNGATLVFAPRTLGARTLPGFELRVYSGRPTAKDTVQATTAMPVVGDAGVSEKTLGDPPFAIFIGASGHVSGEASYPKIADGGSASFAVIPTEPACPRGGFALTFTSAQGATATRTLPCTRAIAGSPMPNPSPTPNTPLVTPASLIYYWPAAPEQSFVATEWGYTHWFATTAGFACGKNVAAFPDVLPSPYSPAYTQAEADASPAPPPDTPYSYPNSGGGSMNDAPARFPLDPAAAGLCSAVVADDDGQPAQANVDVMGWLTATYRGKTYTHATLPVLALPASDFPNKGAAVTIALAKTYDAQALQAQVSFDAACAPYVSARAAGGTTPGAPSATPATASITLTLVSLPNSPVTCGGVIYDQYPRSQSGEGVPFNASLAPANPTTWPPAVQYPLPGETIPGSGCGKDQPQAFTDGNFTTPLGTATDPFGIGFTTDKNGCLFTPGGAKVDQTVDGDPGRSAFVNESNYTGTFQVKDSTCQTALTPAQWVPASAQGPTAAVVEAGASPTPSCSFALVDGSQTGTPPVTQTVVARVGGCSVNCTLAIISKQVTDSPEVCHQDGYGYVSVDSGWTWNEVSAAKILGTSGGVKGGGCSLIDGEGVSATCSNGTWTISSVPSGLPSGIYTYNEDVVLPQTPSWVDPPGAPPGTTYTYPCGAPPFTP